MLRQPPDCNRTETLFPYKTRFRSPPGGVTRPFAQPDGSYVVPLIEGDGSRWVRASELARCARARDAGVDPQDLRALGDPDDQLTIPEARSEEHTSELQSLMRLSYAVFCLKKKKNTKHQVHLN